MLAMNIEITQGSRGVWRRQWFATKIFQNFKGKKALQLKSTLLKKGVFTWIFKNPNL